MVELFSSWACDACDGKSKTTPPDPGALTFGMPAWMQTMMNLLGLTKGKLEPFVTNLNGSFSPLASRHDADLIVIMNTLNGQTEMINKRQDLSPVLSQFWQFSMGNVLELSRLPGSWRNSTNFWTMYFRYVP
jgi:hypothetical protein